MKICVYGAGAIGSLLGGRLAAAGADVTLVARGAHLAAMRERGLTILHGDERLEVPVRCLDAGRGSSPCDVVILTLKAHAVAPALDDIAALLGPQSAIVTAQNGILWWYFHGHPGQFGDLHLPSVDPGGRIWKTLGPERAIGCVVYPSCELAAPGVVRHFEGERLMLGEPDGSHTARVTALSQVLGAAGFKAPVRDRIRDDIWWKLLGNATFNPVSVLTGETLEAMGRDPGTRAVIQRMMEEAVAVASALGVTFAMSIEKRIEVAIAVGAHKTSMLQDYAAGRPLELDALVTAVKELGRLVRVPTPTIDLVLTLVRLKAKPGSDSNLRD